MSGRLRITGGSRRGRKLFSPPVESIRPASDLVRQAVFNMLRASIEGSVFYDVFAGTGIVGLEALSRGAARAIFIEKDRKSVGLIRRNLDHARFGPEASIRSGDAFVWARHFLPDGQSRTVVFLGPPYPLFEEDLPRMLDLVSNVQARLGDDDILVLQFPRFIEPERLPEASGWYRLRHYGKTRIGLWQKAGPEPTPADESSGESEKELETDGTTDAASDDGDSANGMPVAEEPETEPNVPPAALDG